MEVTVRDPRFGHKRHCIFHLALMDHCLGKGSRRVMKTHNRPLRVHMARNYGLLSIACSTNLPDMGVSLLGGGSSKPGQVSR